MILPSFLSSFIIFLLLAFTIAIQMGGAFTVGCVIVLPSTRCKPRLRTSPTFPHERLKGISAELGKLRVQLAMEQCVIVLIGKGERIEVEEEVEGDITAFPDELLEGFSTQLGKLQGHSVIRPSFSDREKGANGTLAGRLVVARVDSSGPQPSRLEIEKDDLSGGHQAAFSGESGYAMR